MSIFDPVSWMATETYNQKIKRLSPRTCETCGSKMRDDRTLCDDCLRDVLDNKDEE